MQANHCGRNNRTRKITILQSLVSDSGEDHQRRLRLLRGRLLENRIFMCCQNITHLTCELKRKSVSLQWWALAVTSFNQEIKLFVSSCGTAWCYGSKRENAITNIKSYLWAFLPSVFHFTITRRKPSDKSRMWGHLQDMWPVFLQKHYHENTKRQGSCSIFKRD